MSRSNTPPLQPSYFGEDLEAQATQKEATREAPSTTPTTQHPRLTRRFPSLAAIAREISQEQTPLDHLIVALRDAAASAALTRSNAEFHESVQRVEAIKQLLDRRRKQRQRIYGEVLRQLAKAQQAQESGQ